MIFIDANMLPKGKVKRQIRDAIVCASLIIAASQAYAATTAPLEVDAIRQKSCAALQHEYDLLAKKYQSNPSFKDYQQHMTTISGAAGVVLRDLAAHKAEYLSQSLATLSSSKSDKEKITPVGAVKIVTTYLVSQKPSVPLTMNGTDVMALQAYQSKYVAGLMEAIQLRAQAALRPESANEIVRLSLIIPMLDRADTDWQPADLGLLPAFVKNPKYVRSGEELALQARHPRLAYLLSEIAKPTGVPMAEPDAKALLAYLQTSADRMFRNKDFSAGQFCLESAITIAKAAGESAKGTELRIRLSEVRGDLGQHALAAEDLKAVMSETTNPDLYGKAAILRVRHLYELKYGENEHPDDLQAKQPDVLSEVAAARQDPRCQAYLPQIIYIGWVTCRRENGTADAESKWRKDFLENFPDHPLGADMYFSSAMTALAASNYEEATRILKFIEYRYPGSSLLPKVKEIRQRLQNVNQPSTRPK